MSPSTGLPSAKESSLRRGRYGNGDAPRERGSHDHWTVERIESARLQRSRSKWRAHSAALVVLSSLGAGGGGEWRTPALASAAARLLKAYAMQVEVLRRLRHGTGQ